MWYSNNKLASSNLINISRSDAKAEKFEVIFVSSTQILIQRLKCEDALKLLPSPPAKVMHILSRCGKTITCDHHQQAAELWASCKCTHCGMVLHGLHTQIA